jgi:hypothetical protein
MTKGAFLLGLKSRNRSVALQSRACKQAGLARLPVQESRLLTRAALAALNALHLLCQNMSAFWPSTHQIDDIKRRVQASG